MTPRLDHTHTYTREHALCSTAAPHCRVWAWTSRACCSPCLRHAQWACWRSTLPARWRCSTQGALQSACCSRATRGSPHPLQPGTHTLCDNRFLCRQQACWCHVCSCPCVLVLSMLMPLCSCPCVLVLSVLVLSLSLCPCVLVLFVLVPLCAGAVCACAHVCWCCLCSCPCMLVLFVLVPLYAGAVCACALVCWCCLCLCPCVLVLSVLMPCMVVPFVLVASAIPFMPLPHVEPVWFESNVLAAS